MGAVAVQARYEKTTDPKRMMIHALLTETIRKDWYAIIDFLPVRTATYVRYDKGAKKAVAWNEGGKETKIDLPLQDGWYVPDGNPFAIPNGKPSNSNNQDALYLQRSQGIGFSGFLGRGFSLVNDSRRRYVYAYFVWPVESGVALIGHVASFASGDSVPQVSSSAGLELIRNPTELIIRGTPEQLDAAVRLIQSLKQ